MDEEIDTRKINNSFLRDHNYATEGIVMKEAGSVAGIFHLLISSSVCHQLFYKSMLYGTPYIDLST